MHRALVYALYKWVKSCNCRALSCQPRAMALCFTSNLFNGVLTSHVNHINLEYISGLWMRPGNIFSILFEIKVLSSMEEGSRNFLIMHRASMNPVLAFLAARSSSAFLIAMTWLGCCGLGLSNRRIAFREKILKRRETISQKKGNIMYSLI